MTKLEQYESLLYLAECLNGYYMTRAEYVQCLMILRLTLKAVSDDNELSAIDKIKLLEIILEHLKAMLYVKEVY